jgi:hypothetical protein
MENWLSSNGHFNTDGPFAGLTKIFPSNIPHASKTTEE